MSPDATRCFDPSAPRDFRRWSLGIMLAAICLTTTLHQPAAGAVGQWWSGFSQDGLDGIGLALLVEGDRLLVAGGFHHAGTRAIDNIAAFDGQRWSAPNQATPDGFPQPINLMALHEGRLQVVSSRQGSFELVEEGWRELGSEPGCGPYVFPPPAASSIRDLLSWNGALQVVGYAWAFEEPEQPMHGYWQSDCYSKNLPLDSGPIQRGTIRRTIEYQGDLILAGDYYLELTLLENMVRWDGSTLEAFDQGFFVPGQGGVVNDLELYDTSLLAFGWLQAGGFPSGLVQFDGQQWGDFEGGRVDGTIWAATVHEGMVYIAGEFTEVQGVPAAGLARWTGSEWQSLADTPIARADIPVQDILFFNGQLYMVGEFWGVDGVVSNSIARWYPPVAADTPPARSEELRLSAAPNPFNPRTTFHFELKGTGDARLDIHDLAGRRVAGVELRDGGSGPGSWTWNGRDAAGKQLASGIYFVRLREGDQEQRLRVTLLK